MKLIVAHDSKGKIVSVARVAPEVKGKVQAAAGLNPRPGRSVLEVDASELANKPLGEIHEGYRVDVKARKLVARPGKGSPARQ